MIKKVSSIAVVVSDARKALDWYVNKLGFKVVDDEGHWITVAAPEGGSLLHLCQGPPLEPGNSGILITCDDVDKTYQELKSKGVEFKVAPRDDGWGKYAIFKDPDGNEFWLMSV